MCNAKLGNHLNGHHSDCVDLGWVAKQWKTCFDLHESLISTKVSASHRKSTQVHARPGQTELQVHPRFQPTSSCDSVWPGLNLATRKQTKEISDLTVVTANCKKAHSGTLMYSSSITHLLYNYKQHPGAQSPIFPRSICPWNSFSPGETHHGIKSGEIWNIFRNLSKIFFNLLRMALNWVGLTGKFS